jgi:hypothetical protein
MKQVDDALDEQETGIIQEADNTASKNTVIDKKGDEGDAA